MAELDIHWSDDGTALVDGLNGVKFAWDDAIIHIAGRLFDEDDELLWPRIREQTVALGLWPEVQTRALRDVASAEENLSYDPYVEEDALVRDRARYARLVTFLGDK